jgi:hypothetical protein
VTTEQNSAPLRDVAQNPDAFARYLAELQRTLLDIGSHLEILQRETRVHCRGTRVEGDRWYHSRLRAMPVEKALKDVRKDLNSLTAGLEKAAHRRHAHDEVVNALPRKRQEKILAKEAKRNPALGAASEYQAPHHPGHVPQYPAQAQEFVNGVYPGQNSGYAGPTSIHNLREDWSA